MVGVAILSVGVTQALLRERTAYEQGQLHSSLSGGGNFLSHHPFLPCLFPMRLQDRRCLRKDCRIGSKRGRVVGAETQLLCFGGVVRCGGCDGPLLSCISADKIPWAHREQLKRLKTEVESLRQRVEEQDAELQSKDELLVLAHPQVPAAQDGADSMQKEQQQRIEQLASELQAERAQRKKLEQALAVEHGKVAQLSQAIAENADSWTVLLVFGACRADMGFCFMLFTAQSSL